MLIKRLVPFVIFLNFVVNLQAQLYFPIVGTYQKKSAQGMAIWEDRAYLFNNGGHCRVLNLKTGEVEREFDLDSAGENTHVNAACFGAEVADGGGLPCIYVSEYNRPSRCFVECINDSASSLVQTIQATEKGRPVFVQSWIVDGKGRHLYAVARQSPPKGEKNSAKVRITKYRLPLLSEGSDIVLTEYDRLDTFMAEFASGTQGGVIKDGMMYLPTGLQESARGRFNARRTLQVIDLKKKAIKKQVDLTFLTVNEPEDIDCYQGKLLLYCGQEGGIYEISLK